jgi:hypothetical protein
VHALAYRVLLLSVCSLSANAAVVMMLQLLLLVMPACYQLLLLCVWACMQLLLL